MKVLLFNGSPNKNGCTNEALNIIASELKAQGVESEIVWLGNGPVRGCIGCGGCKSGGGCVFNDDPVNSIGAKVKCADAYIFGAPVHYASPNGATISALDRLFCAYGCYKQFKPAACIVSARRAGTTASYDVLNKYIGINNMLQVPSTYWNMVHGNTPEQVRKDEEGVSIMRAVASNTVWLLKMLEKVKGTELEKPVLIPKVRTNFIR